MSSPVGITGIGLVTALGTSVEDTWTRLVRGERGISRLSLFDTTGQRANLAAQARTIGEAPEGLSRTTVMALAAAREAIDMARLQIRGGTNATLRVGLIVAGTTGGMFETEALLAGFHADPGSREVLAQMLTHPLSATADVMEAELGPFSRVRTLSSACSGGAAALAVAATWLLADEVDAVVAGGSDALCRLTFTGFNALCAIDPEPCRPFDRRRRGLTLGEGAGFLVVERAEAAKRRNSRVIAELAGWALGAEAHHITNPHAGGTTPVRLIAEALARASLDASQVDYVNAHGTGTPLNDPMEAAALRMALGAEIARIPVSSSKAQIGHTLGAAGAIEAVISVLSIVKQVVPPTAGLDEPDPACALVHVPHEGRPVRVRAALSSSFGFGGMDAVLVLAEPGFAQSRHVPLRSVVITGAAALSPPAGATRLDVEAVTSLDAARVRRLDRAARIGVIVAELARVRTLECGTVPTATRSGIVLGNAFGSVDGLAAFMHRFFEKGPRLASPADFPNLVPSSPVGHTSIYLGLKGPVLAVADLAASSESAVAQAFELVRGGGADCMICGGYEETSDIIERVFAALFRDTDSVFVRSEGASAVVFEADDAARARGASILARVDQVVAWRSGAMPNLRTPADTATARVYAARCEGDLDRLLAQTPWATCPRFACEASAGEHEGLGGIAVVAGIEAIARGEARSILVVGIAKRRGHAFVLSAP